MVIGYCDNECVYNEGDDDGELCFGKCELVFIVGEGINFNFWC